MVSTVPVIESLMILTSFTNCVNAMVPYDVRIIEISFAVLVHPAKQRTIKISSRPLFFIFSVSL